jgi:hypothetical protein
MKYLLSLIIGGALVVSGFGQTRNVLVGTNNAVVQPTNFWSADAVNARSGLGLGTAATNPASAFQPSSLVLSNLASSNAVNLTNLRATNVVGTLSITQGGTGSTNAADARTAFGLGTAATNPASAFQPSSAVLSNLATSNGANLTNIAASNIVGAVAIVNGGTGATNAETARTNLGLGATDKVAFDTVAAKESTGFTSATLNGIQWQSMYPSSNGLIGLYGSGAEGTTTFGINIGTMSGTTAEIALFNANRITFYEPLEFNNTTNAAITRTNLGLGLGSSVAFSNLALSNGAATNLAVRLGSTNRGFYATAGPERIVTVVGGIDSLQVFSNSVETATGIALSVSGAGSFGTNVQIGGPLSFSGTNAAGNATATRTNLGLGWPALTNSNAGTGLVSVNTNGEVVSPTNFWQVAPISTTVQYQTNVTGTSTNAATNSRNLFLFSLSPSVSGITNTVTLPTNTATTFEGDRATIIHLAQTTNAVTAIRQLGAATNLITLNQLDEAVLLMYRSGAWMLADNISYIEPIFFSGTNAAANAAASRTNLGLGTTNSVTFSNVTASGTLTATSTVTAKTNLVVEGFVDYTAARTNNTPTNTPNFAAHAAWIEVKVGTNSFFLPAYQ